jgi:hypothetical protein
MATAAERVQLIQDVFMQLDGQHIRVLKGTVIDMPVAGKMHAKTATVLAESLGPIGPAGGPTTVRNLRYSN